MAKFSEKEQEYLRGQLLGRIATVSADRYPHVVPVAFASDGERLYSNVQYDSKKARNVRGNPGVSFVVDDFLSWEEIRGVFVSGGRSWSRAAGSTRPVGISSTRSTRSTRGAFR